MHGSFPVVLYEPAAHGTAAACAVAETSSNKAEHGPEQPMIACNRTECVPAGAVPPPGPAAPPGCVWTH